MPTPHLTTALRQRFDELLLTWPLQQVITGIPVIIRPGVPHWELDCEGQYGIGHYAKRRELLCDTLAFLDGRGRTDFPMVLAAYVKARDAALQAGLDGRGLDRSRGWDEESALIKKWLSTWLGRAQGPLECWALLRHGYTATATIALLTAWQRECEPGVEPFPFEEFTSLIEDAAQRYHTPQADRPILEFFRLRDLPDIPVEFVVDGLIPKGTLSLLFRPDKEDKTLLAQAGTDWSPGGRYQDLAARWCAQRRGDEPLFGRALMRLQAAWTA